MWARRWACVAALAAGLAAPAGTRELDPAACAARFDVQRDKIIRTEESREMGARYLSELDVGARQECLRLCCETDACDVFVYEEKSPGSCYLFNCGPPEDFRCKFTAHGNFSSGVLALSRRLAELQDQERLAHHAPAPAASPPPPAPPAPTVAAPTPSPTSRGTTSPRPPESRTPPPPPTAPSTSHQMLQPSRRCSRYQFECRAGGECIAVYNACDGVPQCADGSDEAPELACPPPAAPPRTAPAPPPAVPAPALPPPAPVRQPQDNFLSEVAEGAAAEAGGARWPHRLMQAQPPRRYTEGGVSGGGVVTGVGGVVPHIFSHKGGLVQDEGALPYAPFAPPAPPPAWQRRIWQTSPAGGGNEWGGWRTAASDWGDGDSRGWQPPPPLDTETEPGAAVSVANAGGSRSAELVVFPALGGLAPHDAPKKGPRPAAPPRGPPASTPQPRHVVEASAGKKTEPQKEVHLAAARDADDREGRSERPPAALLLLVLGVLMTGVLGVLAGCRARAARRRRRGKPLAHDADYLVNGMYL
ncbi:basic proline-rich protein [Hyposmocoma kahamanoa]|uniref:basic proline-rich protein n=1 Tax=Hyposmocoma kahamanoa TaxID=1477025 RepID=UPI000E6D9A6C|nr:basic proline-rich protein [Hyposmocoma kahamanoa]